MKKLFGGGGSSGSSKPQQLFGGHPSSSNAPLPSSSQQSNDRDYRGQTINIEGITVMVESKLAEGGFSIVFLVKHCHPRQNSGRLYALKRQFINEPALLEACKREIEITKTLGVRHPNIVTYIASSLTPVQNSDGNVFEYFLLTQYYRGSVLRLMNERLAIGQWLSTEEVLRIFTDVCAAVARLHHCQTPVIHRDLKVENLLLDEDGRCVLCDFGSATTRTLSTKTHSRTLVEDEVARFTTLSYRAPEMIDLYAGHPITTKVDIWALGVMLYKLCYFALPFGESALGIQNAAFSFPAEPSYFPPELLGLIVYMLMPEIEQRPDIYQVSIIAYRLRNCQCPVKNLNNVSVPDNAFLLKLLREHRSQKYGSGITSISGALSDKASRTPNNDTPSGQIGPVASTTSVAPRQRPKPRRGQSPTGTPTLDPGLTPVMGAIPAVASTVAAVPSHVVQRLIQQSPTTTPNAVIAPANVPEPGVDIGITTAMSRSITRDVALDAQQPQFEMSARTHAASIQQQQHQQHRRNASDPSAALLDSTHLSAFKPYKSQQHVPTEASADTSATSASWNPFDLDDHSFGLSFDALPRPRKDSNASTVNVKSRESLIIDAPSSSSVGEQAGLDPFGAAPFRPRPQPPPKPANAAALLAQQKKKNSLTDSAADESTMTRLKTLSLQQGSSAIAAASSLKLKKGYKKLVEDGGGIGSTETESAVLRLPPATSASSRLRRRSGGTGADNDSVGSASDLQARMQASGSSTGEDDERVTVGKSKEAAIHSKRSSGHGRHRRVHRTTSSDDNDGDDDDDEENRSTDNSGSGPGADQDLYEGAQRFDNTDDEDLHKLQSAVAVAGNSNIPAASGQGVSSALLADGGIEGSYLEQEIIGRQPLLAEDDDDEHNHQVSSTQYLTSMTAPGGKNTGVGASAASRSTGPTAPSETFELSVLNSCPKSSLAITGDVFRQAPFLASQQALRTVPTSNHQRQHYQQQQQRPVATAGATAAFVNTSFQGE